MVVNHSSLTNERVQKIVRGRNFFDDLKIIAFVLNPIRECVLELEGNRVTLGDCFFHLAKLGAALKKLLKRDNTSFYNHFISVMNK